MAFEFRCNACGEIHRGMPGFGADAPLSYYAIPEAERPARCELGTDDCVIDGSAFFVRGCHEIPVHGAAAPLIWGVWVSLSEQNFRTWINVFDRDHRSDIGPFLGWLNAWLKPYLNAMNLKTRIHLRCHGVRPWIEIEPTDLPIAIEQRDGISADRVAEVYAMMMHSAD
jgi:hypothetical protein